MSIRCHVCRPTRPCCRQPLIQLWERDYHEKFVHPVKGPLRDAWGLGSVWVTCCATYYGMHYDPDTTAYQAVFLGYSGKKLLVEQALSSPYLPPPLKKCLDARTVAKTPHFVKHRSVTIKNVELYNVCVSS